MTSHRVVSFLPAVICMAAIFWFSSQPGNEVAQVAQPLYNSVPTIGKTLKIPWLKVGHIAGYSLLGASLLYGFEPDRRRSALYAIGVTLLYAVTDEMHQTFVPGRSAGIMDVLIDVGAAGIVMLVYLIGKRLGK